MVCSKSDPFTTWVADSSSSLMSIIGYDFKSFQDPSNPVKFLINGNEIISVINEGCNAISVKILFVSFLFGLYAKAIKTIFFSFFGLLILGFSNIIRLVLLNLLLMYLPEYTVLAHDVIFPIFIYGILVLLWLLWIWKFAFDYWKQKLNKMNA